MVDIITYIVVTMVQRASWLVKIVNWIKNPSIQMMGHYMLAIEGKHKNFLYERS